MLSFDTANKKILSFLSVDQFLGRLRHMIVALPEPSILSFTKCGFAHPVII